MKRVAGLLALALGMAAAVRLGGTPPGTALPPPSTGGLAALDPLLQKLTNDRRLLVVGAHPDDENTALLAYVSGALGGEAAYLSLSRGEGGQNLIGDELGVGLGLVRTQELLAARRLDGARQYFTRAYDFGFTKSLEEALQNWPKDVLLADAARVVRRFRPQIVFATFTGTERDGHGQHQASGVVAREVFRIAGDPGAVPQLAREEGLPPWKPATLLRSNWFDPEGSGFTVDTGAVDPLTGRSYQQIAMAGRSLHRSQDMGRLQTPGPAQTGGVWEAGAGGSGERELFAGIDTRLSAIASEIGDAARRRRAAALLDRVARQAGETRRALSPARLADAAPAIAGMRADLLAARELSEGTPGAVAILDEKIAAAESALAIAAGVAIDATTDVETAAPGEGFAATVTVWNAGPAAVAVEGVALESASGWRVPAAAAGRQVAAGKIEEWKLDATVPEGAPPTVPYFLERPLQGALYDWTAVPPSVRGEPAERPPLEAVATVAVAGAKIRLRREATYRFRDEAFGEIRHPLRAVPPVEVSVEPALFVWPVDRRDPRALEVTLVSRANRPLHGQVEAGAPPGWPAPPVERFALAKKGDRTVLSIPIRPPAHPAAGRAALRVAAVLSEGTRLTTAIRLIDYEHIRPTPFPRASEVAWSVLDVKLPPLRSVGYVRGASDRVPEALAAIGLPVHLLSEEELDHGDFARFDAIVVGSRAYETSPALGRANPRLLDYVHAGGLVVVQYQQYPFVEGGFAPAKLEIARPHDRVTDETAPVRVLDPSHPIFRAPNAIGAADWHDWVQERGLYFAHAWDPAYTPLLEMADPGGSPLRGGLLVARVGKGRYVYTGLAFFRQLPAGVPGAYRLFANLLAWR